jgi:hypothetical protein
LGGGSPLEKFCEVKGVLLVSISTDLCEISRESSEEDGPVAAGDLGISISWRAWLRREREGKGGPCRKQWWCVGRRTEGHLVSHEEPE